MRWRGVCPIIEGEVPGDSHAEPDQDLSRFKWAARFALEHRPDVIVQIGDHFGLTSLCYHNSKKAGEGLRVKDDLDAGNEGIRLFEDVLRRHNEASSCAPIAPTSLLNTSSYLGSQLLSRTRPPSPVPSNAPNLQPWSTVATTSHTQIHHPIRALTPSR